MKNPVYFAVKNRKITIFAVFLAVVFGAYSYYILPKQESPYVTSHIALITAVYPGASPEDVEKLVTRKIEDKCMEIDGYDYSESYSSNSLSTVVLRLEQDTDVEKSWEQLRQKMDDIQDELPDECEKIQVNTDLIETAGVIISISGENFAHDELAWVAEGFKKELSRIEGMSRFEIVGDRKYEVAVEVDALKLNYYNVSLDEIATIIGLSNAEIPSGSLDDGTSKINVKVKGGYSSLDEIKEAVVDVSPETGAIVRLKDVASVSMEFEDSSPKTMHNGRNAVLLAGYFKQNRNILIIGNKVNDRIEALKKTLPPGITVDKVLFHPEDVGRSVSDFIINLLESVFFVIVTVFIGNGIRNAVTVATAIPLSVFLTFGAMNVLGIQVNFVSLAALIVSLGMLVDNAIVISDAIQVRIDRGEERMDACVMGVKEVAIPVLTSTVTTIASFFPLLLLKSMAGEFVSSLPQIVIISLIASYLVAIFVAPTIAYVFFRKSRKSDKVPALRKFFNYLLISGMRRKILLIILIAVALGATAFISTRLGLQFFPRAETNIMYIDIKTDQALDISKTETLVQQVSEVLENQKEVVSYTAAIGSGLPKFYITVPIYLNSPDTAQIMVRLDLKKGGRFKDNAAMAEYLQDTFDSIITSGTVVVKQLEIGEPVGSPIIVRVTGEDQARLEEVAREVEGMLRSIKGTVNVSNDITDKLYELEVGVDADKVGYYGMSKFEVQREVSAALYGKTASVFRTGGNEYDIKVKSNIRTKEELENFAVKSSFTGNKVILKEIANIGLKPRVPIIKKHDRELAVTVTGDIRPGYSSAAIQDLLEEKLNGINLHDVRIVYDGEKTKIIEHFGSMGELAVLAALLIYGILLIQFGSFAQPFIILLTIPFSAIGAVMGLYISGQPLSFTALLGMVSLMGIVVNNAIILVSHINNSRAEGASISDACIDASDKRLRPIMLTTITTVVGLIPLVFSDSDLFRPLAISLIGGLSISTFLTLVVVPIAYYMVESRIGSFNRAAS